MVVGRGVSLLKAGRGSKHYFGDFNGDQLASGQILQPGPGQVSYSTTVGFGTARLCVLQLRVRQLHLRRDDDLSFHCDVRTLCSLWSHWLPRPQAQSRQSDRIVIPQLL